MAKCKYCKAPNATYLIGVSAYCGYNCATTSATKILTRLRKSRTKAERKQTREQRAILNQTITHWKPKAQYAFNNFIRNRDISHGCISCDNNETHTNNVLIDVVGGRWDCGHYLSVGASPELRFSEDNAHKQCKRCNRRLSGNAIKYRARLIKRIGQYRVDILEGPHELQHWKWQDYQAVCKWYTNLNNKMRKEIC